MPPKNNESSISRDQILRRYWELANLDPEVTKGSIAGQLKALDSLCEQAPADKTGSRRPSSFYEPDWLKKQR